MAINEFLKLLYRFGAKKANPVVSEAPRTIDPNQFDPNRTYEPVGNGEILTNCPKCGGGYPSQLVAACPYCATNRPGTFYREIGVKSQSKPEAQTASYPDFGLRKVPIGYAGEGDRITGGTVIIDDFSEINFVGATNSVNAGDNIEVRGMVAPIIKAKDFFVVEAVVTTKMQVKYKPEIGTLVVDPNGEFTAGDFAVIKKMIIGSNARVSFAYNGEVNNVLMAPGSSIEAGDFFEQGSFEEISEDKFQELRAKVLKKSLIGK